MLRRLGKEKHYAVVQIRKLIPSTRVDRGSTFRLRQHGINHSCFLLTQGSANFLSRGPKNEMIPLGGPPLLSKEEHSAHFNIVLLYLSIVCQ